MEKRRSKSYTKDEKIAMLLQLRANNGKLSKTERETGVSRQTLMRWRDEYNKSADQLIAVGDNLEISLLAANLEERYKESKEHFMKATEVVKLLALQKIFDLLQGETNLKYVNDTLKILQDITMTNEISNKVDKSTANYLELIQQQIMRKTKEFENE
jgi:transposase-like protein